MNEQTKEICRVVQSVALALVTLGMCVGRAFVETHALSASGTYQALAHVFVGALIGAAIPTRSRFLWVLVGVLCAVELLAFFLLR